MKISFFDILTTKKLTMYFSYSQHDFASFPENCLIQENGSSYNCQSALSLDYLHLSYSCYFHGRIYTDRSQITLLCAVCLIVSDYNDNASSFRFGPVSFFFKLMYQSWWAKNSFLCMLSTQRASNTFSM